jgi:hypothetical protein
VVKRILVGFLTALVALTGVLLVRTTALEPAAAPSQALPALAVDSEKAAQHLAGSALRDGHHSRWGDVACEAFWPCTST